MSGEARGGQQGGGFHQWALTIGGLVTAAAAVIGVIAVRNSGSTPTPTTISSIETSTTSGSAICSPPSLKGSTNSYGDRIFNEASSPKYAEIASNICFDTRAAAEAAGYRSYDECPAAVPVKANVDSRAGSGAKSWFYLPTTSGYSYVNPEQCFASAGAAEGAGYTLKP